MTNQTLDFLASKVLTALKKTDMAASWIRDKEHEFKEMDRLKVLRSLTSLDAENLEAVCDELGVSIDDIQATFRVLRKI